MTFYTLVKHSQIWKEITLSTELTKLRCSWQLSGWDVIKNGHNYSRQRKRRKCEHFI